MKNIHRLNAMIALYVAVLFFLLLFVLTVPLTIQRNLTITQDIIVREEIIETALLAALFSVSFFILTRFKSTLNSYERKFNRIGKEKSKLLSRLADAFRYIGTINVEIQEIHSILQSLDNYPATRKEIKGLVNYLITRTMIIARSSWVAIRMIDKKNGKTVYEDKVVRSARKFPAAMIGNREILENKTVPGLMTIITNKKNADLITACILPEVECTDEEAILIKLIIDQIEMHFLLYHRDSFHVRNHQI